MGFKTFITNNTLFKHLTPLFILIIAFSIISCQVDNVYATEQWREDGSQETVLGTSDASDLDTAIWENVVSPLDTLLSNYRQGCQIKYASASTLTVELGQAVVSNSAGTIRLMLKNTSNTTVSFAANMDTGAEANSTQYYIWIFQQTTSDTDFDVCISTSSTAPSSKTYYRKLGQFYNDASGNITLIKNDDPEELASYDSGWFAVAVSTDYTKTHGLGTTKLLVKAYFATDSDGTNMGEANMDITGSDGRGGKVGVITTTTLKFMTLSTLAYSSYTAYNNSTAATYARIIAVSIE